MNSIIFSLLMMMLIVSTCSSPIEKPNEVRIIKSEYEARDDGYKYEYETSDGQKKSEESVQKYLGENTKPINVVYGSYSYIGPDGVTYVVEYVADENGFRPVGVHIPGNRPEPTAPPSFLPPNAYISLIG